MQKPHRFEKSNVLPEKYNVSKGNSIALFSSNTFVFLLRVSWGTQYLCENAKAFFLPSHIFSSVNFV